MALFCIISEIKRVLVENRHFCTQLAFNGPVRNIVIPFGTEKLDQTANKLWWYIMFSRLDKIPACDGQTDGQTSCHGIVNAIHTRCAVKTNVHCVCSFVWPWSALLQRRRQRLGLFCPLDCCSVVLVIANGRRCLSVIQQDRCRRVVGAAHCQHQCCVAQPITLVHWRTCNRSVTSQVTDASGIFGHAVHYETNKATQLNSTSSWVELCGYKHPLR